MPQKADHKESRINQSSLVCHNRTFTAGEVCADTFGEPAGQKPTPPRPSGAEMQRGRSRDTFKHQDPDSSNSSGYTNWSNKLFARCRSAVAKPSAKRAWIGPSSSRASARRP